MAFKVGKKSSINKQSRQIKGKKTIFLPTRSLIAESTLQTGLCTVAVNYSDLALNSNMELCVLFIIAGFMSNIKNKSMISNEIHFIRC